MSTENSTTHSISERPKTATVVHRKRGRKGDQIVKAFKAVPLGEREDAAVDLETFAKGFGVSVKSLRQLKRYDSCPETGQVFAKKSKDTGKLEIWREPNTKSKYLP